MLLVVNYHYVSEKVYPYPGIIPVMPENLKNQITTLGGYFKFVSLRDVVDAVSRKKRLPRRSCLLTFDDGLREQYDAARPILKSLGVAAAFFINPGPVAESKVSHVHKIHILRSCVGPADMEAAVLEELASRGLSIHWNDGFSQEDIAAQYPYDEPGAARIKYLLNFALPFGIRDEIVSVLFESYIGREDDYSKRFYMQEDCWQTLSGEESLGIHSLRHIPLSTLDRENIKRQINEAIGILRARTGKSADAISYPYGTPEAVTTAVAAAAAEANLKAGFTMERAFNQTLEHPLLLARVDTNDAPGGKTPRFHIAKNNIRLVDGVNWRRCLWVKEKGWL